MKFLYIVVSVIFIMIINFSCAKEKQNNNNMPEANNSTAQKTQPANDSEYQYPNDNGIGPIKELLLKDVDQVLALRGQKIFTMQCMACHQLDTRSVGPPLRNITKKNTPVFIMNYLLNTTEMQRKDPILMKLVAEYKVIMPDQQLTRDDARAVLEYLRSVEN